MITNFIISNKLKELWNKIYKILNILNYKDNNKLIQIMNIKICLNRYKNQIYNRKYNIMNEIYV